MGPEQNDDTTDLLVAYALGALEPAELARVGRLLEERPELRAQLAELRATAELLPYGLPESEPPPELRARVLARAVGREGSASASAATSGRQVVGGERRTLRGWLYGLGALATTALAALLIVFGQLSGLRAELAEVRGQLAEVRGQLAQAQEQVAAIQAERSDLAQALASAQTIGSLQGPGGAATVLRGANDQLLVAARLPPLAQGRVYQLWLVGEGAPQSAGTFTVDSAGNGVVALGPGAPTGVTLAITDEPAPGSPGPTTPILLSGQLT